MSKFTYEDYVDHCEQNPHTPEPEVHQYADWVDRVYYELFREFAQHGKSMGYWDLGPRRSWGKKA